MGIPYVSGCETSMEAAESMIEPAKTMERRVLEYIGFMGECGATDDDIEQQLDMRHQTASARRRGLVLKGLVKDSGYKGRTRSGRRAIAWVLVTDEE